MIKALLTALALLLAGLPAAAEPLAKDVFGRTPGPTGGQAQVIGGYARGCISGAAQLPETGPTWQAMRLSRGRNWGHPQLVDFIVGLSQAARQIGWPGIYVGDMSQPRGGPMLSGHASHQAGLDVDIWMLPPRSLRLTPGQRENISSVSIAGRGGVQLSGNWTAGHAALIRAAASDRRVARIFVDPLAKVWMCENAPGNYLRKVRPMNGHDFHFHVRLACPAGSPGCQPQDAPPAGDGCAEARQWIANRINPPKARPQPPNDEYRHPRSFRLSDLPRQCTAVATAR